VKCDASPSSIFNNPIGRYVMSSKRWMVLGSITLLVSCGGGSGTSSNSEVSPESTAVAITMEDLVTAKTIWQQTNGSLATTVLNGGVGVSGGNIFGVLANSESGKISIWNWDMKQFLAGPELAIEDILRVDECCGIDNVQLVDLTGDSNDDIFVDYHLNNFAGKAFSQVSGIWKSLTFDGYDTLDSPHLSGTVVSDISRTCLPSCAGGPKIPITYKWNGTEFVGSAEDDFGNKFTLMKSPTCAAYTPSDYGPYKLCDKGPGIRDLQEVLYESGLLYSSSSKPVDGYFGPETEYSIKVYQYQNHLTVDGIVEGQWYHELIESYYLNE